MSCPNCKSTNVWDDNLHWGCNNCSWSSLAGLNPTRTPSNPNDAYEVRQRPIDYDEYHSRCVDKDWDADPPDYGDDDE